MNYEPKPPMGIMPKYIHDQKRFENLCKAMERAYAMKLIIPIDWIVEYNEYCK